MATGIICIILVIIAVIAIKGYTKRLSSGCCGTGSEPSLKHVKVKDKNLAHYQMCIRDSSKADLCAG